MTNQKITNFEFLYIGHSRRDMKFFVSALDRRFPGIFISGLALNRPNGNYQQKILNSLLPNSRMYDLTQTKLYVTGVQFELLSILLHRFLKISNSSMLRKVMLNLECIQERRIIKRARKFSKPELSQVILKLDNFESVAAINQITVNIAFHGNRNLEDQCRKKACRLYPDWSETWSIAIKSSERKGAQIDIFTCEFASGNQYSDSSTLILPMSGVDDSLMNQSLDLSKKKPQVLFVGSWTLRKGLPIVLDLARVNPEIIFVLAGVPTSKALGEITSLNLRNLRVYRNPSRGKILELYAESRFFILPTFFEGFGLSLLEAMIFGCIPITSKNNFLPDFAKGVESVYIAEENILQEYQCFLQESLALSEEELIEFAKRNQALAREFSDLKLMARVDSLLTEEFLAQALGNRLQPRKDFLE